MASTWGQSFGGAWGGSWGAIESLGIRPSGGIPHDWSRHPWLYNPALLKKKRKELIAEIPAIISEEAQKSVEKAISQRIERQQAIDLASAEQELRASLALLQKQWDEQYKRLLLLEYQIYMMELEEASIAMLLFEM